MDSLIEAAVPAEGLLVVTGIEVRYSDAILALRGVSLAVRQGEIVVLLGPNGAGKTTTLKAVSNLLAAERGQLSKGRITLDGESTAGIAPGDLVGRGMVQVLEGRHCFAHLTVEENLITGALLHHPGRAALTADLDRVYAYFPGLKAKRRIRAGYASGGEQQMIAIGRALMSSASADAAGRAFDGFGAARRGGHLPRRAATEPRRGDRFPDRRTEHRHRAALCPWRLRFGNRPSDAARAGA